MRKTGSTDPVPYVELQEIMAVHWRKELLRRRRHRRIRVALITAPITFLLVAALCAFLR